MNIYFVCTGNTCRSPMAEAILRAKRIEGVNVKSAGIYAMPGGSMSSGTTQVLTEQNMLIHHQSSPVTLEDLQWADLVLTMTNSHKQGLLQAFPQVADKVFSLKEYATDTHGDVSDPYGGSVDIYRQTFEELSTLIDLVVKKLD